MIIILYYCLFLLVTSFIISLIAKLIIEVQMKFIYIFGINTLIGIIITLFLVYIN